MMVEPYPVAVGAADLHLDEFIWRSRPEITGDALHGFKQIVELSFKHGVEDVFVAGDAWECLPVNSPSVRIISDVQKLLARLVEGGRHLHAIEGQHDEKSPNYFEAIEPKFKSADQELVNLNGGVNAYFMSWRPKRLLADAIAQADASADVVICHQVWEEGMGGINVEGSIKGLPGKLVISGDYHQFKSSKVKRKDGSKLRFISPGATHMRKINEPDQHYALLLFNDLSLKRVPLTSRVVRRFVITDEKDFEQLYSDLPSVLAEADSESTARKLPVRLQTPVVHVSDSSGVPRAQSRLQTLVKDNCHLFYQRTSVASPVDLSSPHTQEVMSLSSYVKDEVGTDREVGELLSSAFEADDPKQKLIQYRDSYLGD